MKWLQYLGLDKVVSNGVERTHMDHFVKGFDDGLDVILTQEKPTEGHIIQIAPGFWQVTREPYDFNKWIEESVAVTGDEMILEMQDDYTQMLRKPAES